jgi:hypothetical protein
MNVLSADIPEASEADNNDRIANFAVSMSPLSVEVSTGVKPIMKTAINA